MGHYRQYPWGPNIYHCQSLLSGTYHKFVYRFDKYDLVTILTVVSQPWAAISKWEIRENF